jgi:hypothetical protein
MADNIQITAGTGTTVWTDEVTGPKHAQVIKIADGTDAGTDMVTADANRGLKVNPGPLVRLSVTPVVNTTQYTAGDAVGGEMTFSGAARFSGGGGTVVGLTVVDKSQQQPTLELVLFNQDFTGTTNNSPFDPSDADLANVVGVIQLAAWYDFNDNSVGYASCSLPFVCATTELRGQLVTRSAPTLISSSDIIVILHILQE